MVTAFAILLVVHGLIHLLGVAKGLGLAELPQLTQPIPPALGALWLLATGLFLATAVALFTSPRWWWALGLCALAASMLAIVPSWADAKMGALANAVVLAGVGVGFVSQGPWGLRAQFDRDVHERLPAVAAAAPLAESDLARLPEPVRQYLRRAGVIGRPRVSSFHVTMHGRIREGRASRWMPFAAEQVNVVMPAARMFYFDATMLALPVQGYHRYVGGAATMRVKAAGTIPVATASGPEMTQAETVTLFNDMCLMAPATLIEPGIVWTTIDARTVRAAFTNGGHTVQAVLSFDADGDLVDFVSDDRYRSSARAAPRRERWSTPVSGYGRFDGVRLPSRAEGRWHDADGEYAYIELTIDDVRYTPHAD